MFLIKYSASSTVGHPSDVRPPIQSFMGIVCQYMLANWDPN